MFATLDPSFHKLKIALKLLNYTKMMFFMCVRQIYRPIVHEVAKDENLEIIFDDGTVMKHLKREDANKFVVE